MKLLRILSKFTLLHIIFMCSIFLSQLEVAYASGFFSGIESQINPDSGPVKIKKLQTLLADLWLYKGPVSGVYKDIESTLIDYQIKKGIIQNQDDWGAGYFGRKTLTALQNDFPDNFKAKASVYLKHEAVNLGETNFVITAYYSPLPWQLNYITGTYNGDIALNGDWKHTSSGKDVFPWLLAWPKNYAFWTKIYLEWIGVGTIEDRGGAIVNAWDRWHIADRIDIWMWYGDEWLQRAKKWWQRTIKGEVLENYFQNNIQFQSSLLTSYYPIELDSKNSSDIQVQSMQKLFTQLWYYTGDIDGNYENFKNNVINFQIQNSIISDTGASDAGYIWQKTVAFLEKKYPSGMFIVKDKYNFSPDTRDILEISLNKIRAVLQKKSNFDTLGFLDYKNTFITQIVQAIPQVTDIVKKLQLDYIKNNL